MSQLNALLSGAIATGSLLAALFFLRFWRSSGDRFFLFFSLSFAIEGINRGVIAMLTSAGEDPPAYYLIRLLAYALILVAIIDKNRVRQAPRDD